MEMAENGEDEVMRLLHLWGLSDLKAKFKANYIVLQALEFLTEEDIVNLIPKIGQRAIFRGRLVQWRQQNGVSSPKSIASYRVENNPEPKTDSAPIPKVQEPISTPPIKIPPKVCANFKKLPPKPKPQDEKSPKPCIQSKVQKFYITPVAHNPVTTVPLPSPPAPVMQSQITAPDLTPFVTSIIRVETNCEKKSKTQSPESDPPAKVNRTRILQKIKIADAPATAAPESPQQSVAKPPEPMQSTEENKEDPYGGEQPDARHLYPIIKLETESADTSWSEYNSEPEAKPVSEAQPQVITKREPEEMVADSTDFQPETMAPPLEPDFFNENDNPLLKLEQMSPKDINPRRKRARTQRKFDIRTILMSSRPGLEVLQFYEKNDRLDAERRKMLVDAIIQDCWTANRHITPTECIAIATDIVRVLPNEKIEDYFKAQAGKNSKSPLYSKYWNKRRRFSIEKKGPPPPTLPHTRRRNRNSLTQRANAVEVDDTFVIS